MPRNRDPNSDSLKTVRQLLIQKFIIGEKAAMRIRIMRYGFFFIFISLCLTAQDIKTVTSRKTEGSIFIDGKILEADWQNAQVLSGFLQFQPRLGEPAPFQTQVRILYSDTHIYFGVFCHDPEPEKIIARLTKRDSDLTDDDAIGIGLDTFMDGRTAYYFFTNSLGTQADGRLSDNGRTSDSTWDGEWQSAASTGPDGWSAELAIPLSTLRYKPGEAINWGLGLVRSIPRNLEKDTWTGPMEDYARVSQFGQLQGLDLKESKKKLDIIPHLITELKEGEPIRVTAGVDGRYAVSQDFAAALTLNPDFATVEADQEVINLTRFELSLPEKRNFFLEGSEIYSQRIRLFYSRRIADIYGGVKLYGKKDGVEFSALTAQSEADHDLGIGSSNFSVFRIKKDVFKSSTIGFLAANRMNGGLNSGNVGIDLTHFFSETFNMTGQLAVSYGDFNRGNTAFFLRPSYDSATFHAHLRYTQLGENFANNANSVGFVSDDDRRELDSAVEKTWWIKKHGIDRIAYDSNYNIYWSKKAGYLKSYQIDQGLEMDLKNKFSCEVNYQYEYKLYEKDFFNHEWEFALGYNTREWQSAEIKYTFGRNFDLDFRLLGVAFNYKLFKTLSLEYELNRLIFHPDPEDESTWVHVLRISNYFSRNLYLKFFYQTHTAISKINYQALFVYQYKPPFGTIQLAFQKGGLKYGEAGDRAFSLFLKLTYVIHI